MLSQIGGEMIRKLGIVLGVLLLVLVGALVAGYVALQQIDWNEYKQPVTDAAFDATGRRLDLGGDLDLQIGLQPGIRLSGVSFANADWGSRPNMATLDHLLVRFRLLPLFSGELEVSRVELTGLDLLLETRKDGLANWDFSDVEATPETGVSPPVPVPPASDPASPDAPAGAAQPLAMLLQHAEIENAVIVMRDGSTGDEQRIAVDRLVAAASRLRGPLSLEVAAHYGAEPIELSGEIEGLPTLMAGGSLDVDLKVSAGGAKIGLIGTIGKPLDGADLDLDLDFQTARLGRLGGLAGSDLPDLGPVALALNLSGGGDAYAVRDLDLNIGETKIGGTVDVSLAGERPRIDAWLVAPRIDLADLQEPSLAARGPSRVRAAPGIQLVAVESGGSERLFSDDPLPLAGLDAVDANLRLDADLLVADRLDLDNLALALVLDGGKLQVERFAAGLAGGRIDLALGLDASRSTPPLTLAGTVRHLRVGDVAAAQGSNVIEDGPLDLDFDLKGRGSSLHQIMASLAGNFELSMGEAIVRDEYAAIALSGLKSMVQQGVSDKATVACVFGDFEIAEGIARPSGLIVHLSSIALFGKGKIDLGREQLKLEFDRQAQSLAASGALPPFTLKGPLTDPKPGIATGALVGKVVDLGAGLVGSGQSRDKTKVTGCRDLLARYQKEQKERGSTADVARKAAEDLGGKAGETGKKVVDKFKSLFK